MADDLRRFLNDEPIVARPPGLVERSLRWVRKQRRSAVAAVTGALAAALVAAGALGGWEVYSTSRLGYLTLATTGEALEAAIFDDHDRPVRPSFTIPNPAPEALAAGSYRVRLSGVGRLSETVHVTIEPGEKHEYTIAADDRSVWSEDVPLGTHVDVVEASDRTDTVLLQPTASGFRLRRIDGVPTFTGREVALEFNSAEDRLAWDQVRADWDRMPPGFVRPAPDLNGDGEPDLVLTSTKSGSLLAASPYSNKVLWWRRPADGAQLAAEPLARDTNGDSRPDVIVAFMSTQAAWVEALAGDSGEKLWRREIKREWIDGLVALSSNFGTEPAKSSILLGGGNLGPIIVVVRAHAVALDGATGAVVWTAPELNLHPHQLPQLADLNGDGDEDLLVVGDPTSAGAGNAAGSMVVAELSAIDLPGGQLLWRTPLTVNPKADNSNGGSLAWPFIVDLEPGKPAVAVPAKFTTPHGTWQGVELLDGASGLPRWSRRLCRQRDDRPIKMPQADVAQIEQLLAAPDFDGDGHRELVVASVGPLATDLAMVEIAPGTTADRVYLYVDVLSGDDGHTLGLWMKPGIQRFDVGRLDWWQPDRDGGRQLVVRNSTRAIGVHDVYPPVIDVVALPSGETRHTGHGEFPRAGDLNGDGIADLLEAGSPSGSRRRVAALAGTSPEAWRRFGAWRPADDYDGDGIGEWLESDLVARPAINIISGQDGRLLNRSRLKWSSDEVWAGHRLVVPKSPVDVDGDSVPDFLATANFFSSASSGVEKATLPVQALSGRTGHRLWWARELPLPPEFKQPRLRLVALPPVCAELGHRQSDVFCPYWLVRSTPNVARVGLARVSGKNGSIIWTTLLGQEIALGGLSMPIEFGFIPQYAFADITSDGVRDVFIVVPADAGANWSGRAFSLQAVDGHDGTLVWQRPLTALAYGNGFEEVPVLLAADVDGDGQAEVVLTDYTIQSQRGQIDYQTLVLAGSSGEPKWTWSFTTGANYHQPLAPRLVDLNGDRQVAVCLALPETFDGNRAHPPEIVVLDGRGQVKARLPGEPPLLAGDIDGDGRSELVFACAGQVLAYRGDLGEPLWRWSFSTRTSGAVHTLLPPTDGNGAVVVVADERGQFLDLDGATGQALWRGMAPKPPGPYLPTASDAAVAISNRPGASGSSAVPQLAGWPLPFSVSRMMLPTTPVGAYLADGKISWQPRGPIDDPRWLRPLPWSPPEPKAPQMLAQAMLLALGFSVGLAALPGAWLWWVVRHRTFGMRALLLLPLVVGIAFTTWTLLPKGGLGVGVPTAIRMLALTALVIGGLQELVLVWVLVSWTVHRRWGRLALLALAITGLSAAFGAVLLWMEAGQVDPAERYAWRGWPFIGVVGAATCGLALLMTFALRPPVRSVRRLFQYAARG